MKFVSLHVISLLHGIQSATLPFGARPGVPEMGHVPRERSRVELRIHRCKIRLSSGMSPTFASA